MLKEAPPDALVISLARLPSHGRRVAAVTKEYKKLREVQDATFAAEKARIDNQLAMHELFSPEQRQEMEKMRSEFRGRMMQRGPGGGMGPRGPRPMGPPQPPPPADNGR